MPTAGEYKHEPLGIPCHCYVRRRINHSLSHKSCLRRPTEQHPDNELPTKPPKTVTFDPVLQIRSFTGDFRSTDHHKLLQDICAQQPPPPHIRQRSPHRHTAHPTPVLQRHESVSVDDDDDDDDNDGATPTHAEKSSAQQPLTNEPSANNFDWTLCDKITSFFGFQKVNLVSNHSTTAADDSANVSETSKSTSDDDTHPTDDNNNDISPSHDCSRTMDLSTKTEQIYGNQQQQQQSRCSAGQACKYAERPRERTPPRKYAAAPDKAGGVRKIRDGGRNSRTSSSSWEYGKFAAARKLSLTDDNDNENDDDDAAATAANSYSQFSACRRDGHTVSPYQVSGRALNAGYADSDSYNSPPPYDQDTVPTMRTFRSAYSAAAHDDDDDDATSAAAAAASVTAQSSAVDGCYSLSEKSDDYIYAALDNTDRDYEYVPVKSAAIRRRTESENLDSCPTVPTVFEGGCSGGGGGGNNYTSHSFVKHKTKSDLTADTCPEKSSGGGGGGGGHHHRCDNNMLTPQSAPDLQTIMSSPYDIKFLNECVRAYVRDAGENEFQLDILAKIQTIERTVDETSPLSRKSQTVERTLMDDILRMTPVALFWTGCAFLVALVYILLFSCAKDHESR